MKFIHYFCFSYERKKADYIEKLKKEYQSVLGVGKTQPNPEESKVAYYTIYVAQVNIHAGKTSRLTSFFLALDAG